MIDWTILYIAIPAVIMTGLSKGGLGGGLSMLGTPMLALYMAPLQAAAIMLPVMILMDFVGLYTYRRHVEWALLKSLVPAGLLGVGIGSVTATLVPAEAVRILVGSIAIIFGVVEFVRDARKMPARSPKNSTAIIWGTLSGFTSFISNAGGPPYQAYTVPLRMDKMTFVGTSVVFFTIINLVKMVSYFALGEVTTDNLTISAALIPVAILGVLAGIWAVKKITQTFFYRLTYIAMLIVGTKLLWDGLIRLPAG